MDGMTLEEVREGLNKPDSGHRVYSIRDFVEEDEVAELHKAHRIKRKKKVAFDDVDCLVGEILGRFGWDVYERWNNGEIDSSWMARILNAERAREAAERMEVISTIYESVLGTVSKRPKSNFEMVRRILETNKKIMEGDI